MKSIVGIDPGSDGAVFIYSASGGFTCYRTKRDLGHALAHLRALPKANTLVAIEKLHAIWGCSASSTFGLGKACGYWQGVCAALGLKLIDVSPIDWKLETGCIIERPKTRGMLAKTRAIILKAHKKNLKTLSITQANSAVKGLNCSHDGIADACNIARWALTRA